MKTKQNILENTTRFNAHLDIITAKICKQASINVIAKTWKGVIIQIKNKTWRIESWQI